jgi:hypothetical protein
VKQVLFGVVVVLVVLVYGCSNGGGRQDVASPEYSIERESASTSYTVIHDFHDWNDGTDTVGTGDGWGYGNPYYGKTELAALDAVDVTKVFIFSEEDDYWGDGGYLDIKSDIALDVTWEDSLVAVKVCGFESQTAGHHTDARMFVMVADTSDSWHSYVVVYKGLDSSTRWDYWYYYDVGSTITGTILDFDVAPDGQFWIVAYYNSGYFKAKIWDSWPAHGTFSTFIGSSTWDNNVRQNSGPYGVVAKVAMGAYNFNTYDHNFAYSIPGAEEVKVYYQGANNSTWTNSTTLGFSSWDLDIACDGGYDNLFLWSQEIQQAKWYTINGSGTATSRATFASYDGILTNGGINGLAWISAGCVNSGGDDYVEIMLQSFTDHWVEVFKNFSD